MEMEMRERGKERRESYLSKPVVGSSRNSKLGLVMSS